MKEYEYGLAKWIQISNFLAFVSGNRERILKLASYLFRFVLVRRKKQNYSQFVAISLWRGNPLTCRVMARLKSGSNQRSRITRVPNDCLEEQKFFAPFARIRRRFYLNKVVITVSEQWTFILKIDYLTGRFVTFMVVFFINVTFLSVAS